MEAIIGRGATSQETPITRQPVLPIHSGGGWSSDLFLSNQGSQAVTGITVSFYSDAGAPLPIESNLGTGASFTLNLNAGASQVMRISASGSLAVGYVVIRMPTAGSVQVTEVFRFEQAGVVLAELGMPQQSAGMHFTFPVEVSSSRGIGTGIAVANPTFDSGAAPAQTALVNLIPCGEKTRTSYNCGSRDGLET